MQDDWWDNTDRVRQLIRFEGMTFLGNITPTDIDALIELKNKILCIYEVKYKHKPVPRGQELAMERLVQQAKGAGKKGIAVIAEHSVDDPHKDIMLANLRVRSVYTSETLEWKEPPEEVDVKTLTDNYIERNYQKK